MKKSAEDISSAVKWHDTNKKAKYVLRTILGRTQLRTDSMYYLIKVCDHKIKNVISENTAKVNLLISPPYSALR